MAEREPRLDPVFGALSHSERWFPSPAHVLRRAALLDVFSAFPPGRLLELGCGAGRLLIDWDRLGHSGWGVDVDAESRALAEECVGDFGAAFEVAPAPPSPEAEEFDYLVVIEVLEHLPDPAATLSEWLRHLKEGGVLIASVPAFARLWGKSDEWAGHVRRFEPEEFTRLVEGVGMEVLSLRLYGFPLANLSRLAGNASSALKTRRRGQSVGRGAATRASGRDRSIESALRNLLLSPPSVALLRLGIALQRRYARRRKGVGLILTARKRGDDGPSSR